MVTPYHLPKKRGALKSTPKVSLFLETQFSQSLTPPSPSSPPPPLVFCWPHPHPHISSIKKQNNKGHTFYFCSQTIHLQDQTERESRRVLKPKEETALEREREREKSSSSSIATLPPSPLSSSLPLATCSRDGLNLFFDFIIFMRKTMFCDSNGENLENNTKL